ncbi:hypothetical protein N9P66_04465 [Salibacteraceae bacterium]|jgi:hypothetical protein|nr:hypothetical protein [Salibacteraceae bacterium]
MRKTFFFILLLALITSGLSSYAQVPDVGNIYLTGKMVNESRKGMEASISVCKKGYKIETFPTSRIGRFEFPMPLQDSLAYVVMAEGYVSKTILLDARVPLGKQKADYNFPFFVDLYPVERTPTPVDIKRPIGKIIFSDTQIICNIDFTKLQNERLKAFV